MPKNKCLNGKSAACAAWSPVGYSQQLMKHSGGYWHGGRVKVAAVPSMGRVAALAAVLGLVPAPWSDVNAQEQDDDTTDAARATEEFVVTGSRLKRDAFSSISPLRIITAEVKREAGLVGAGGNLHESTASSGARIDPTFTPTFSGFVLDDGPGVVPANLRGLGSARTLVLVNGRRIGATGVEGAPQAVDLGVVPGSLVRTYDLLLDGASSIYGSDAVGGVANIVLRKDFDGFELNVFTGRPHHPQGDEDMLAMSWGRNFDRGFIGGGLEYKFNEAVPESARPWTGTCDRHVEIDQAGRIRHQEQFHTTVYKMRWDECRTGTLAGRVSVPLVGSVYHTGRDAPGAYWAGFSESSLWGFGVDADGNGEADVSFREHSLNGRTLFKHVFPQRKALSGMVYGEHALEGALNLKPYFEVLYFKRDVFVNNGAYRLWPHVPPRNPYNICNPEGDGVDCQLAYNRLLTNPNFIAQFQNRFRATCATERIPIPFEACTPATYGFVRPPIGPARTLPITAVRGDRTLVWARTNFARAVAGVSGDLPMLNFGSLSGWSFDVSVARSLSDSTATRPGVRFDRLALALGWYSKEYIPCVNDIDEATRLRRGALEAGRALPAVRADVEPGCVPVNMFAPSLYKGVVGDFATQAERDYVFDERNFATEVEMTLLSAHFTGTVFNMPAGEVPAGFGLEYRRDKINSLPDPVARDGLLFGFFADGGAVGSRDVWEVFGEIEFPLVGGKAAKIAKRMDLNLSARWTDDEFHGGTATGSAKIGWRPVDSLLIRATWGTAYRAPNLRELFLAGQTGFLNVYDPCLIPEDAIDPLAGGYNAERDDREPHVLENCRRDGVDPTVASNNGFNHYSVERKAGGSLDLKEETSESLSFGFSWEQPFTNRFDFALGLTYYKIKIDNAIVGPSLGYIVYDCYLSNTGGTFCPRITREANPASPLMDIIDAGFVNRDNETVRGVDVNLAYNQTFEIFDRPVDVTFDLAAHRLIERFDVFLNNTGLRDRNEHHHERPFPKRTAIADLRVGYGDWHARWQTVYTSGMHQGSALEDEWSQALTGSSDTCLGPPNDLLCRDHRAAGDHHIHRLSVGYRANTWNVLLGVRNVFDTPPPMVDSTETSYQINNAAMGYSIGGRTYFLGVDYSFGRGT